ncbi:MAG: hypothetical protein WC091_18590 [Sulfuricellaceae bacterium]
MNAHPDTASKIKAWCVHIFTASGMVVGFKALESAYSGNPYDTIFWLVLTALIDGIDGAFARKFRVTEVLPQIDGHLIDFVVDFVNFVVTPCVVFYQMKMAPPPLLFPCVAAILYASLYHYGNKEQVTSDFHFCGFPAWWNLVVYYLFILDLGQWPNLVITIGVVVLHFLPVKFIYITRMQRNRIPAAIALLMLLAANAIILLRHPDVGVGIKIAAVAPLIFLAALGSIKRELLPFKRHAGKKNG